MRFKEINKGHVPQVLKNMKKQDNIVIKELKHIADQICTHRLNLSLL